MATDLFPREDDEPLFGAVARYAREMRVGNWNRFLHQMFGYRAQFSPALGYNLGFVAEQVRAVWGMSSRELIESTTLFPFYATFATPSELGRLYAEIETRRLGTLPTFMLKLIQQVKIVRCCDACVDEDVSRGRPRHWRRVHQVPGVLVCPTHNCWLRALRYGSCSSTPWPTIEDALSSGEILGLSLTEEQRFNVHQVARAAQWLLEARRSVDSESMLRFCWKAAHSSGFAHGRDQLAARRLTSAFASFYGPEYLRFVGLLPTTAQNWIIGRLRRYQTATCALPNILLGIFGAALGTGHEQSSWPYCPSMFAPHGPNHRVEVREAHEGRHYARCRCGFSFTYSEVMQGVPAGVVATVYGPDYIREAQRRYFSGQSIAEIARDLRIAESTARRMARVYSADVTPNRHMSVHAMVEKWRQAIASAGSIGIASRAEPGLWKALRRYAPEELGGVSTADRGL